MTVAVLGLLAKKLKIAYPILLVFGGLALSFVPGLPELELSPEFIFFFCLPPLLFPAAMFIPWRDFRLNLRPILLLAVGLVLFTTVAVGYLAHYFFGLPLPAGFVLGAIVSPPDAVAASAIAQRLRLPRRIVTILEGESLINDATALVAYRFGIAALATGAFSLPRATGEFFLVAIGGVLVGLIIGWAAAWFHCRVDDPPIEITVSFLTPFLAYLVAERLHLSGVLAVVAAGLYLGWRLPEITSTGTRLQGGPFWNMIEFMMNGFVFLLIGLELPIVIRGLAGESMARLVSDALLISVSIILIRIMWVFAATYLPLVFMRGSHSVPPWRHVAVVSWTGMRGVVSLAAALAIPATIQNGKPFPGRNLILFLTFVVIAATLVVQGITLPLLIRALGVKDDHGGEREEREARIRANQAAFDRLCQLEKELDQADLETLRRLRIEYEDRLRQLESYDPEEGDGVLRIFSTVYDRLSKEALNAEREAILALRNQDVINDEVLRNIQRDIDFAEARLEHQR